MYCGARWYDPSLGRFVSADTIVPNPGNPQSLNRFACVYNNPLRYVDPSGHLSEDKIMSYFGVETWDEVLSRFGDGGDLEGRWGWLETLRTAQLGDEIQVFNLNNHLWPPQGSSLLRGTLVDRDSQLFLQSTQGLVAANSAAQLGNAYGISRPANAHSSLPPHFGPYYAESQYLHYCLSYDLAGVDWFGVTRDAAGIAADLVSCGTAGRAVNATEVALKAGDLLDAVSLGWSMLNVTSVGARGQVPAEELADLALGEC